jgi:26S proteasome regulatory subunit (ATPase 3-interacting protein)
MEALTKALNDETVSLNATLKSLRSTYATLNSTLSTADLRESIAVIGPERTQILERLGALRSGSVQPVSKEEKDIIDKESKVWEKAVAVRKSIAEDMWGAIAEGLPGKAEEDTLRVCSSLYLFSMDSGVVF